MDYIYIGKIVNTHGIKGEIRIISDFNYKEMIFKKGFSIYIGNDKNKEIINTYRVHKNYDMVTLENINNINDVLKYKGLNAYINKNDLENIIFDEDYIGLEVYTDKYVGNVTDIMKSKAHDILVIENDENKYLVPKIDEFINKIDLENNKIYINNIIGLIDENWCSNTFSWNVYRYYSRINYQKSY